MEKHTKSIIDFIGEPIQIRYKYALKLIDETSFKRSRVENVLVYDGPGTISINSLLHRKKFYGPSLLAEANESEPLGTKIISVRDLLFIDAQLFIDTGGQTLALKDRHGFLKLKVNTASWRSILRQLKS